MYARSYVSRLAQSLAQWELLFFRHDLHVLSHAGLDVRGRGEGWQGRPRGRAAVGRFSWGSAAMSSQGVTVLLFRALTFNRSGSLRCKQEIPLRIFFFFSFKDFFF